jgi:hypothetical protein
MRKKSISLMPTVILLAALVSLCGTASALEGESKASLTIRLYGGLGHQTIGDLNAGLKGFSDSLIYLQTASGYSAGGGYSPLHWGIDLGGDVVFQFSPNLGIGVGSGYFRTTKTSDLKLTAMLPGLHNENFTFTPTVSVVPIRASLFVFIPVGRALMISLHAGPEYYLASLSSHIRDEFPAWWWNERDDKTTGRGFGVQGGIGFELRLSPGFSLLLEGQGRWAKVNEMTGTRSYRNSFGFQEQQNGTLYYWTDLWTFKPFPYIGVHDTLPSEPWQQNARKAVLDLSGWSAVAGFVFHF